MKITLNELKGILGIPLDLKKELQVASTGRLMLQHPKKEYLIMVKSGEETKFTDKKPIYCFILDSSPEYKWIDDYGVVAIISNEPSSMKNSGISI